MSTYTLTCTREVNLEALDDALATFTTLSQIHRSKAKDEVSSNFDYNTSDPDDLMHALVAKFDGLKDVHDVDWYTKGEQNIIVTVDSDNISQADIVVRYLARCLIMSENDPTNTVRISRDDVVMTAQHNVWYHGEPNARIGGKNILYTDVD